MALAALFSLVPYLPCLPAQPRTGERTERRSGPEWSGQKRPAPFKYSVIDSGPSEKLPNLGRQPQAVPQRSESRSAPPF
jgi:hypothetical protein